MGDQKTDGLVLLGETGIQRGKLLGGERRSAGAGLCTLPLPLPSEPRSTPFSYLEGKNPLQVKQSFLLIVGRLLGGGGGR